MDANDESSRFGTVCLHTLSTRSVLLQPQGRDSLWLHDQAHFESDDQLPGLLGLRQHPIAFKTNPAARILLDAGKLQQHGRRVHGGYDPKELFKPREEPLPQWSSGPDSHADVSRQFLSSWLRGHRSQGL